MLKAWALIRETFGARIGGFGVEEFEEDFGGDFGVEGF
jgi:hypothetical protein